MNKTVALEVKQSACSSQTQSKNEVNINGDGLGKEVTINRDGLGKEVNMNGDGLGKEVRETTATRTVTDQQV